MGVIFLIHNTLQPISASFLVFCCHLGGAAETAVQADLIRTMAVLLTAWALQQMCHQPKHDV